MAHTKAAKLIGYIPYEDLESSGFLLPIFSISGNDGNYIQVPDISGNKISNFSIIEEIEKDYFNAVDSGVIVHSGGPLNFGFRDHLSHNHFGSLEHLSNIFEIFMLSSDDIATKMQIAELTGSPDIKKKYRAQMIDAVEDFLGPTASDHFQQNSIFLQALWDCLISKIVDEKDLKNLHENRRMLLLEADFELPGFFPLKLQTWLQDSLSIDPIDIESQVRAEMPDSSTNMVQSKEDTNALRHHIFSELKEIMAPRRQEARVSLLVKKIMQNPGMGKHLAQQFNDRTGFSQHATNIINSNIDNFQLAPDTGFIEWLVDALYSICYPRQRGVLLYELASNLGQYAAFADAILSRLETLARKMSRPLCQRLKKSFAILTLRHVTLR